VKHPAYHLRQNKAIDRLLFLELIQLLKSSASIDFNLYEYFGFGGPYLDDVRMLHEAFPALNCNSIEKNLHTHHRQKFHRNSKNTTLHRSDIKSFIRSEFDVDTQSIFWLDYTNFTPDCLDEFSEVLQKAGEYSVVKITVRSEPDVLALSKAKKFLNAKLIAELTESCIQDFYYQFGAYLGGPPDKSEFNPANFPSLVQSIICLAAKKTLPYLSGQTYQVLNSSKYADGVLMLSVTGIKCPTSNTSEIKAIYKKWPFSDFDWSDPDHIDVPDLSVKERLSLEKHLPCKAGTGKQLQKSLGYNIDNSLSASHRKLIQYEKFYSYFPMFAKMSV